MSKSPIVARGAVVAAALLLVSCGGAPPPRATSTGERPPAAVDPPLPWADFVERVRGPSPTRVTLDDGGVLTLQDDQRILLGAGGLPVATAEGPEGARSVHRVPAELGGGLLFTSQGGIAWCQAPLGPLRWISRIPTREVSFGPRGVLATFVDGRRRLLDIGTGAATSVTPAFAVSMEVLDRGLSAALLQGGAVVVSRDAGATWVPAPAHGRAFVSLGQLEGQLEGRLGEEPEGGPALLLVDDQGASFRLDGRGLVQIPTRGAPPRPPSPDPRWVTQEDPLEAAIARGTSLDEGRIIVPARGSVYILDRTSGAIESVETGVLPPNRPCTAIGLSGEVLFACPEDGRVSVFVRPRIGGHVTLEATFAGAGRLVRGGEDALLYTGGCDGDASKIGVACRRTRAEARVGVRPVAWAPIDRATLFASQPASVILAWVPTETSALAILGGDVFGVLDAATGERSVLTPEQGRKLAAVVQPRSDFVEHRFRAVDGAIEGWASDSSHVRIEQGGARITPGAFKLGGARFAGARALAVGPDDTLWQSTDWGRTFVEVPAPPFRVGSANVCGDVGCSFGAWIRRGWSTRPASPRRRDRQGALGIELSPPLLPELRCDTSGPQVRSAQTGEPDGDRLGLGAELLRAGELSVAFHAGGDDPVGRVSTDEGTSALESGAPPRDAGGALADLANTRRLRLTAPFDPAGAILTASYPSGLLVDAAQRAGLTPPTVDILRGAGGMLPVLAAGVTTDSPAVLLVRDGIPLGLWVRPREPVVALALQQGDDELGSPTAAIHTADGALALLSVDGSGGARVLRLAPGRVERVFEVPATSSSHHAAAMPDTLAIGPSGELAVLRLPTSTPPDDADPALLLRAPGPRGATPPERLAPWSTLTIDGAPGCTSTEGVRAIVTSHPSWIQLGPRRPDAGRMTARVRWSASRVCLEAVEVSYLRHETPNGALQSRMVATFGASPRAGLVLVDRGVELREPRTCSLVAPR